VLHVRSDVELDGGGVWQVQVSPDDDQEVPEVRRQGLRQLDPVSGHANTRYGAAGSTKNSAQVSGSTPL
jgi:hypothetical protein